MNIYSFYLACIPFFIALWFYGNPIGALRSVIQLRLRFREYLMKKYGYDLAKISDTLLREYGRKNNIPKDIVERAINDTRQKTAKRLGRSYVDKKFPKTPVEEFFS